MSILEKVVSRLESIERRHYELEGEIQEAVDSGNTDAISILQTEYGRNMPTVNLYRKWKELREQITQAEKVASEDPELAELARSEVEELEEKISTVETQTLELICADSDADGKSVFLEVRGATGGDEASLFAGDLLRMYERYCEQKHWKFELVSISPGTYGGYKEATALVSGKGAYGDLKFESGGHRVQRVPETESQGRIHTSVCTVAVLPEVKVEDIKISPDDLRIETFRASGAGGQHVNKTDSAVRITHIPTSTVVECQSDRSQHRNKDMALAVLRSRIQEGIDRENQSKKASLRKSQVGTGERSEKIRTYNFPQGRITDHRIKLTLHKLEEVLAGNLSPIISEMKKFHVIQSALSPAEADGRA